MKETTEERGKKLRCDILQKAFACASDSRYTELRNVLVYSKWFSLVIRAVGANIACECGTAIRICSWYFVHYMLYFFSLLFCCFSLFFSSYSSFFLPAPFCSYILLWQIPIALNIVKSPASLTHTCMTFCIGIGIVSVALASSSHSAEAAALAA